MGRPRKHNFLEQESTAEEKPFFEEISELEGTLEETNMPVETIVNSADGIGAIITPSITNGQVYDSRWRDIDSGATSGMPHYVSDKPKGEGTLAHFRRTRAFANKRWNEVGKFVDFMTGVDLPFEPKYCRNRFN